MVDEEGMVRARDVAELLGLRRYEVDRLLQSGDLPSIRVHPKLRLVPLQEVERYRDAHPPAAVTPTYDPTAAWMAYGKRIAEGRGHDHGRGAADAEDGVGPYQ